MTDQEREDAILEALADGFPPSEVAMFLTDRDVAAGEYDGCSSDLEMAYSDYVAQAERILEQVGG